MKICSHCKQELDEIQFHKNKNTKDGLNFWCKKCVKDNFLKFEEKRREYIKDYYQKHKEENKEKKKVIDKKYYQKNRDLLLKKQKNYLELNKDHILKYQKNYYIDNKEKVLSRNKSYNKNHKEEINKYQKDRREDNINFKIAHNLRNRFNQALQRNLKKSHAIKLLGCTIEEFKVYIEAQFTENMNWNNYGLGKNRWSFDHIMPCDNFDLTKIKEQKKCFNYTNYQPLWFSDNCSKNNKLNWIKK